MKDFWNQIPNWIKVILSSVISILILVHFEFLYSLFSYVSNDEIIKQGGFWTLFSLIFSSPIAFRYFGVLETEMLQSKLIILAKILILKSIIRL